MKSGVFFCHEQCERGYVFVLTITAVRKNYLHNWKESKMLTLANDIQACLPTHNTSIKCFLPIARDFHAKINENEITHLR